MSQADFETLRIEYGIFIIKIQCLDKMPQWTAKPTCYGVIHKYVLNMAHFHFYKKVGFAVNYW